MRFETFIAKIYVVTYKFALPQIKDVWIGANL